MNKWREWAIRISSWSDSRHAAYAFEIVQIGYGLVYNHRCSMDADTNDRV